MTSFSQIVRYYRCRKGHNQAKRDKRRQTGHFQLCVFLFSCTHAWVSRVASHPAAFSIEIIIFINGNHKYQCLIKKFCSSFGNWYFKFQICYLLHKFTINVIMIKSSIKHSKSLVVYSFYWNTTIQIKGPGNKDLLWMLQNFLFPGPFYRSISIKSVNNQTLSVSYWWLDHNSGALARAKRVRSGEPWVRKFGYDVAYARPPAHPYTHFM